MSLRELLGRRDVLNKKAAGIQESIKPLLDAVGEQLTEVEKEITALLSADLTAIRKLQEKEFGAVHITRDGFRVTETIAKKVKWDQEKLFGVFHKIQSTGDNPFDWMKAEFKVGEKEYGAYPKNIQAVFAPARTVTPGDPKLEFKSMEAPDA
jgi:hypothetical protein